MAKPTRLVAACRRIESAIEKATQSGKGAHKTREAMMRDLAFWLMACRRSDDFPRLTSLRLPWKTWDSQLSLPGFRLAAALHLMDKRQASAARAVTRSGAAQADLRYGRDLLKRVGINVHEMVRQQDAWVETEILAQTEDMVLRLESRALEDMLLASAEAYLPTRGSHFTEVFGLCFGSVRALSPKKLANQLQINVSRVATQMRARGNAHEVKPNWRSLNAHLDVADKFFPHLEVVGEYHTHPYKTFAHLKKHQGWEYSSTDEESLEYIAGRIAERKSKPRFSLVVAVAQGGKSGKSAVRRRANVVQISVDDLFFVIGAYRIRGDATYDDRVTLHLPAVI